jgi:hypothetical protein
MTIENRTIVARHRQSDPGKLLHLIRGDLDWIVMKALEKGSVSRRYETAVGFAQDIQRHLSKEPVHGTGSGQSYISLPAPCKSASSWYLSRWRAVTAALVVGLSVAIYALFKEGKALEGRRAATPAGADQRHASGESELKARHFLVCGLICRWVQQALRTNNIWASSRAAEQT